MGGGNRRCDEWVRYESSNLVVTEDKEDEGTVT